MVRCERCGRENADDARFCSGCGAPLVVEEPARREERKVVTVLFADLVGFTARAEAMDPEDVRAVLAPYHARLRRELESHGGTVEKFIGDAVMALFGAPASHEDDPERAVRAAIAIRDWAREDGDLELRIAVTTGEALIHLSARPNEGEGMASGDVVNTAARLQAAAPVNGILVDETTYRATEPVIAYEKHDPVSAKGKMEPVTVWEAVEARARFGADVAAPQTPLIGRDQERELLASALGRARNERAVQLVTLVGVPGIGKSRLVAELFQMISEAPELITWRQGRSLPYGDGVTYWALSEMVKNQAGILDTDAAGQAAQKLHEEIARLFTDDAEARSVEARLRLLVGIETTAEQAEDKRAESFYAWRRFFEELADKRPAVLVFEDLHWADDDLLDFIDHLVDWAADVPLLCICTARPELLDRRPAWSGGKPSASTISLSPLSDDETALLLGVLLGRAVLPAEQQAALLARAGGNPLYAEQFARMLAERGDADELPLPETVQGIIAARLDGLEPDEKALLQDAAVVGKVFWAGALARLDGRDRPGVEQSLHALARKEFVRRQRRPSVEGESEYSFLHLLVRDVAYGQIPRAARSEKHRAVAEWMTSLGRAEDHSEMLAHHYLQALEYAQVAGVDRALEERARHALRSAGDRALALNAFAAAARYLSAALELWPSGDPDRGYVLFSLGAARYRAEQSGLTELEEARDALLRHGDRETAAEAEALASYLDTNAQVAHARLEHALALVSDRPPSRSKAFVLARLAYRAASFGDSAWEQYAREALAMTETLGFEDLRAYVLRTIGTVRGQAGERGGVEALGQAVEAADTIDSLESVGARINLAALHQDRGELRRAFQVQARARHDAERFGVRDEIRHLDAELVYECYWSGRWDEGSRAADGFLAEVESEAPHAPGELGCRYAQAHIRLARDDVAGALVDCERAVRVAREWPAWGTLPFALAAHARVLLAAGMPSEAGDLVTEALEAWRKDGPGSYAYTGPDLAAALVELGRKEELSPVVALAPVSSLWLDAANAFAAGDYVHVADLYAEIGSLPDEADARLKAGHDDQVRRALDFYRSVGATRYIREGEALLAASA
ncbi:MAG TPA: AAA family ATPase [Gaiellaceae bacterium]|nr:AAA family ATPase [Gaiellaceae bacterium]